MNDALAQHLIATCPQRLPDSRWLLPVDDEQHLWWVESGTVDLFAVAAVAADGGAATGAREHLYRATAGQMFFALETTALGVGCRLLAVSGAGTRLRELTFDVLAQAAAADAEGAAQTARLVTAWVGAVTEGGRIGVQPKTYRTLRAGLGQAVQAGQVLVPAERLLFVRWRQGLSSWLGQAKLPAAPDAGLLPLPRQAWLQAVGDGEVDACCAAAALGQVDLWTGLRSFHSLMVRASLAEFERVAAQEALRVRIQAEHGTERLQAGLSDLAGILRPAAAEVFAELSSDPLLAACQLVGQRIGVHFTAPPRTSAVGADPIEEIAMMAKVRWRQVALRGDWWLADGGHMLGKLQENQHPVALIHTARGYQLRDPQTQSVLAVDEAVAATLVPFAHTFFASLPARPLVLRDLMAFSYQSIRNDFRRLLGLGLLVGLMGLATPIVTGYVFDTLIPSADKAQLAQVSAGLVAMAIASAMFLLARSMATLRLESRLSASLQAAMWGRLLSLPLPFFRRYTAGDLALRLNGINTIRQALSGATLGTIFSSLFSVVSVALLLWYSATLAALALALVAGAAAISIGIGLVKLRYERPMAQAQGRLSGLVFECLRGVTKLRVTGAESRAFANWAGQFAAMRKLALGSGKAHNASEVVNDLYRVLADAALFAMVALLLNKAAAQPAIAMAAGGAAGAAMTTGQFIAFSGAFGQLMGAVMGLSRTLLDVLNIVPVYERLKPVLEAAPEADEGRSHPGELQGQIDLAGLSFRYLPGSPLVLDKVTLSIRPGSFVAVVGPSGSGKSTLLRCLLGFEQPTAGGVFYDDQNLAELDARAVRRQMGVVLQHSRVMPDDVFTNIVGTSLLTLDDAWEAARLCGLEDDIQAMPMGMHTVISEGGSTLSGGQRQRILIARAIVQRPRILLFDEATSALDNPTQAVVTNNLNQLRATRVVIAHRLSTIQHADLIVVLDQGRIVQSGQYATLLGEPGLFQDLVRRQMV